MDQLIGALFLFGVPILAWFGWDWVAHKATGKTAKHRARDKRAKRFQDHMIIGQAEGMAVRDAYERHRRQGY